MRYLPFVMGLVVVVDSSAVRAASQCGAVPEMMLLLDRSGSMAEQIDGQTKASIARDAINDLLNSFAGKLRFGLSLFPAWPHQSACGTAKVNVAAGGTTAASIKGLLGSATSEGDTPIAASLDAMGDHFAAKADRPRYVVLVTDGMETCVAPPAPLTKPGSCSWDNGNNFRRCGGCGWQFCLKSGNWSLDCEGRYACPYGQTCQADGTCGGPAGGSSTVADAAEKLSQAGIKTFVIGFGSKVDADALAAIAASGDTIDYFQADNINQLKTALTKIANEISCCGNGEIDGGELCDPEISAGQPGACPTSCDDNDPCTQDVQSGEGCQQGCDNTPIPGCSACGDGKVDPDESCDIAIPPGEPGGCPTGCVDDGDPCSSDAVSGTQCSATCAYDPLPPNPTAADGCCPAGATQEQDIDCQSFVQVGGGCDCRTAGKTDGGGCALLLLAVAGLCLRRRRR